MAKFITFGVCPVNGSCYVSFPERPGARFMWTTWKSAGEHHNATGHLQYTVRTHAEQGCDVCQAMCTEFIKQKLLGNI